MVYPVSCTAFCYVTVITLFIKKLGWSVQILGGPDPSTPLVVAPLAHPSLQSKRQIDRFSHFCTAHGRPGKVSSAWSGMSLSLIAPSYGIWAPSNTCFHGPPESITQTASRSVQPFLHCSKQSVVILTTGRCFFL